MYYFRWRTYKSHIHPTNCSAVGGFPPSKDCKNRTDGIDFVVRRVPHVALLALCLRPAATPAPCDPGCYLLLR